MTPNRELPPGKDAEQAETAQLLRRLRRQGVRQVEWVTTSDGLRLRAKVQVGRSHRELTTGAHDEQADALRELAAAVSAANPRPARKSKVTARPVARPPVAPAEPPDTELLGERLAREAREKAAARQAREEAAHAARRAGAAQHAADAQNRRPGRQGGR